MKEEIIRLECIERKDINKKSVKTFSPPGARIWAVVYLSEPRPHKCVNCAVVCAIDIIVWFLALMSVIHVTLESWFKIIFMMNVCNHCSLSLPKSSWIFMTLHDTFNKSSINLHKVFIKLGLSASQFLRNWLSIYYPKTYRMPSTRPDRSSTGPCFLERPHFDEI